MPPTTCAVSKSGIVVVPNACDSLVANRRLTGVASNLVGKLNIRKCQADIGVIAERVDAGHKDVADGFVAIG